MSDRDDVEARLDELEETLSALRDELESTRGPAAFPRSPRPRAFLRFTDQYAIPAAIAAMRANIRALEVLRAGIRATDTSRTSRAADRSARDRATGAGRASLERLDGALADLESAMTGPGTPASPEARELLSEARRLNREIRDRVALEEGRSARDAVRIDVESELESIREEVAEDDEPADDGETP